MLKILSTVGAVALNLLVLFSSIKMLSYLDKHVFKGDETE